MSSIKKLALPIKKKDEEKRRWVDGETKEFWNANCGIRSKLKAEGSRPKVPAYAEALVGKQSPKKNYNA